MNMQRFFINKPRTAASDVLDFLIKSALSVCFFKNLIYKVGLLRMASLSHLASHKLQKIRHTLVYNVLSLAVDILVWHVKSKNNLNCDNCQ